MRRGVIDAVTVTATATLRAKQMDFTVHLQNKTKRGGGEVMKLRRGKAHSKR